tara:strand:- start:24487 stop:25314 length:828 start_codon:yes stop_codon:yes gene_type:complete
MKLKSFFPKKRFGQHWLINQNVLDKIINNSDLNKDDIVLEIGPGKGALTKRLLDTEIKGLHAVELDRDLIEFLRDRFSKVAKFSIQQDDILSIDLRNFDYKFNKVIANIPYNITGPILEMFLGGLGKRPKYNLEKLVFLMQKEVADRIIAKEGSSNNSALSTRIKLISNVEKICDIPPSSFNPPPKVHSSLVIFNPLPTQSRLDMKTEKFIEKFLKITFNARRKKIRNTIKDILSDDEILILEEMTDVSFDLRPQDLYLTEWVRIAKSYIKISNC